MISWSYSVKEFKKISTLINILLVIFILNTLSGTVADPDLWGYLAFGKLFWQGGNFPYQDVYSYVPTLNPWVYHEWLTGVVFSPLYEKTGAMGLQLLKYLVGLITVYFIYLTARHRGAHPLAAATVLLITIGFINVGYSAVRAQIFTYFFFILTLYLLERYRKSRQWLLLGIIPITMLVWCNLHGGFVSGLGLIALYAAGEAIARRRFLPYVVILSLSIITTLINPYGLKYWSYILYAVTMPRPEIWEWGTAFQVIEIGSASMQGIYYVTIIFITFLFIWWGKWWRDITGLIILCVTLFQGLLHARHIVFFLILVGAYLPAIVTAFFREATVRPWVKVWQYGFVRIMCPVILLFLAGYAGYKFLSEDRLTLRIPSERTQDDKFYYPVGAINYIRNQDLRGNLLIHFDWGEYALWNLYPQCKVAIDGRYETVYPHLLTREYFNFLYGREKWGAFLEHYPPDMILVKTPSKIYSLLQKDINWRQVFADSGSALFKFYNKHLRHAHE